MIRHQNKKSETPAQWDNFNKMTQEHFDDNGMIFGQPIRFIYKDVESGNNKSEDVPYADACNIIRGIQSQDKMIQLTKAGWMKTIDIKKFYSVPTITVKKTQIESSKQTPLFEKSFEELRKFLCDELVRLHDRTEITGLKDPRSIVFPKFLELKTKEELIEAWRKFNSEGRK
jgi:hypothetical protein